MKASQGVSSDAGGFASLTKGGIVSVMDRQDIIARLHANRAAFQARGVEHVALFGSRARGDAAPESDTDILLELSPAARLSVFDYAGLKLFVADVVGGPVDVVNRAALKPHVRPAALTDAIYAF